MTKHWTEQSIKDFLYRIATDFVVQLEEKMKSVPLTRTQLADELKVTKSSVSQIFNNPGNLKLETIIQYARAVKMKVAIVAYDDNDPNNERGPINSDVFRVCWERQNKPTDFWSLKETQPTAMPDKCFTVQARLGAYIIPFGKYRTHTNPLNASEDLSDKMLPAPNDAARLAAQPEATNDEISRRQLLAQNIFAGLGVKRNAGLGS